ncbi:hypothetical protein QLS71_007215 [Mariniflexile litorale]|uniref:XrtJ-associated TM-motif-TM protein n=1 Tax=Mariniflexile litorale TaxID=3045158 RepID=A0AAU7EJZ7_9FLAO|nr:hypothetical protein [Mariniflexile sp. KMM 9835]MDQ8211263.1 hypothetical protein [Mariniflexile sp. KMM 9835]
MIIQNKRIFASILFVLISFVCAAAQAGGSTPPPPMTPPPGLQLPIDGGLLVATCVGLFYGAKKLLFNKN